MWYTSRFFTVLVHVCTKSRIKQDMQKTLCSRISRISALRYYVGCIDMNIYRYILTEGRNWAEEFQERKKGKETFWKESYAIALDSC